MSTAPPPHTHITLTLTSSPHTVTHTRVYHRELLECFRRRELLDWETVRATYEPVLREGTADCPVTSVFSEGEGETRWQDFRKRVIEHVRTHNTDSAGVKLSVSHFLEHPSCSYVLHPCHSTAII